MQLLRRAGVGIEAADVFVSCDEQVTKRTGALFHRVRSHYRLGAGKICHTGDHPVSDVQQAKKAGVAVTPYLRSLPSPTEVTLASVGIDTRDRLLASAIGGSARRARINREMQGREDVIWGIATGVAGPLLFGYVHWLLLSAREMAIGRLYFLARDGQILLQIARRVCAHYKLNLDLRYLHASRRAWFLPSTATGSTRERVTAVLSDQTIAISDLLRSLQIDPADVRTALYHAGFPEQTWAHPIEVSRLGGVLSAHPFDSLILDRARQGFELCSEYLRDQGMFDGASYAIVDIGWKGRLQAALARMLRSVGAPGPRGFYLGLRERPDESAIGPTYVYLDGPDANMLNPSLVELFSSADHGSTLKYERSPDGQVQAVLAAEERAVSDWGLPILQDGINAFAAEMIDSLGVLDEQAVKVTAVLRQSGTLAVGRLVQHPDAHEAAVLGAFPHASGQFHQDLGELAPRISLSSVLSSLLNPVALRGKTHWPQASIARSTPAPKLVGRLWDLRVDGMPRLRKWLRRAHDE